MQRKWALILLSLSFLVLAGCDIESFVDSTQYKEDFHESHPMKAGSRLYLENMNGSIEIAGWDQETADISGTKYAGNESAMKAIKVDIVSSGDSLRIRTIAPSGRWGNMGARYVIRVPRKTSLERIESSNGRIGVSGLDATARLETSNGSIEASDVSGPVSLRTSNGSVRAERISKGLEARTSNGAIRANLGSPMESGTVRLTTSNGSVELAMTDFKTQDVVITTSNGSITVRLPGSVSADVKASTSNSSITNEFDSAFKGRSEKHALEGTIGSGGPLLTLTTSNGGIRLLRF
jgi:hypothetical protein